MAAKTQRWEGFDPNLADAPHSIRTWDVYRIVACNKLKKQTADMAEFCNKLDGNAAAQCRAAIEALEEVQQVLEQPCEGDECGFQE